jgi:hypothetical protein
MSTISRPGREVGALRDAHRPLPIITLSVVLVLLAVGSIQGGIAMVLHPENPLGMSVSYLEGTPVDTYLWPGIFLLALAAASLVTAIGLIVPWAWHWAGPIERAIGFRWPWLGAVATGGVLLTFEVIELFLVPFHPVMHPLVIGIALLIIGLATAPGSRAHLRIAPYRRD